MHTAVLIDPRYRDHDTGAGHPERPERIAVIEDMLHDWRGGTLEHIEARLAREADLAAIHTDRLVAQIRATSGHMRQHIDADTATSEDSYEVALLAAGGVLAMVDAVIDGAVRNGFAFVRPPGHHATKDQSMGFCLFNNVAIAAAHLRKAHGLERIAIIDWDLHHGNGTQDIFYDDPSVLYVSLHQYPYYPGTGAYSEIGEGPGRGYTVNVPFSRGVGDPGFQAAFDEIIEPVLLQFAPEFVLISAGFDCHHRDPLGGLQVTETGFKTMASSLLRVAAETCSGRLAAVLEGGYDLDAIRHSAEAVLGQLCHGPTHAGEKLDSGTAFDALRTTLGGYWRF